MPRPSGVPASDFPQHTLQAYALNDRMNQLLLEHLDSRAWRAKSPGHKGRTIAAIFGHVHNIRCKWLRLSAPHLKLPARLDPGRLHAEAGASGACQECFALFPDAGRGSERSPFNR
jgi:hypothetical protein